MVCSVQVVAALARSVGLVALGVAAKHTDAVLREEKPSNRSVEVGRSVVHR